MRKKIALLLVGLLLLTMCGCGEKTSGTNQNEAVQNETVSAEVKSIELTKENILEYVQFDGEFTGGKHTMSIINYAEATLEFQAYPVAAGQFENVEITLVATSDDATFTYMNDMGNYWHLDSDDSNTDRIEITFRLGVDGKFSKNYAVKCLNNTGDLNGSSDFTIISVSGTFRPN